ncbi:hypothetical protein [Rhodoligotrophos ferricapiens]|uniref:hypothetical protein n=1 Tax=Rhodoligotrophos ferricapiens TaxID=3069264 RepID=UPI00315DEE0F
MAVSPRKAPGLAGRALLMTLTDVAPDDVEAFNAWYNREHIDDLLGLAGFRRARRYGAEMMRPRFMALYEVDDIAILTAPHYLDLLANQSPWSREIIGRFTYHRRICATVTVDLSRGVGGAAGLIHFRRPSDMDALRLFISDRGIPAVIDRFGLHGGFLAEGDLDAVNAPIIRLGITLPQASEPDCLLVVEGQSVGGTARGVDMLVSELTAHGFMGEPWLAGSYALFYANQSPA